MYMKRRYDLRPALRNNVAERISFALEPFSIPVVIEN